MQRLYHARKGIEVTERTLLRARNHSSDGQGQPDEGHCRRSTSVTVPVPQTHRVTEAIELKMD